MSTIAAGTTAGTALVSTGDTSGTLQLQVNGTTPAVTLNTSGAVGVGSSPAYGTAGQVLSSQGSGSAPIWRDGGSSTAASLQSPAQTGLLEYNGTALFFTPIGTQRGVLPAEQLYVLNSANVGANATGAQSIFGVGVTLSSSTYYAFEAVYALSKTSGTTSHSLSILFGGTATLNNIAYQINGQYNGTGFGVTTTALSNMQPNFVQTAAAFAVGSGSSASVYFMVLVKGMVSINAGGTFIPQYQLSAAPGGAYTTAVNSYFKIYPIGAAGSNVNVGTWA